MELIKTIADIKNKLDVLRFEKKTIGLVPTMGALHQGHLKLVEQAKKHCDIVVVSIFVNPKQFSIGEDYESYPRQLEQDMQLLQQAGGVNFVFAPEVKEIWLDDNDTIVEVPSLSHILIGASRPNHFVGVTTIVNKLFNICKPTKAFFGEKDFQQLVIIRKMVKDLNIDVEIVGVEIHREADGVAASSRNVFLSEQERNTAKIIPNSLQQANNLFKAGENNKRILLEKIKSILNTEKQIIIDDLDIRYADNLQKVNEIIERTAVILLAVKIGQTRLLDQLILEY